MASALAPLVRAMLRFLNKHDSPPVTDFGKIPPFMLKVRMAGHWEVHYINWPHVGDAVEISDELGPVIILDWSPR